MSERLLALGDIHGCHVALDTLLARLDIRPADTVVVLGDVVDRGPGSRQVVEGLIDLQSRCNFVLIKGNHEEMMLDGLAGGQWWTAWLSNGGAEALQSYGGADRIPQAHLDWLASGRGYWETEQAVFVHASLEPGVPLREQKPEWLRWTRLTGFESPLPTGQLVVCGHSPQMTGKPARLPGWICIDTWACGTGWLTCLDVGSNEVWQANQAGSFRRLV